MNLNGVRCKNPALLWFPCTAAVPYTQCVVLGICQAPSPVARDYPMGSIAEQPKRGASERTEEGLAAPVDASLLLSGANIHSIN